MKRILLPILVIGIFLLGACGTPTGVPSAEEQSKIPAEIEQQVYAISQGSEDYSVSEVKDDGTVYRIYIELLFEPQSYTEVEGCTDSACVNCHEIFTQAGINRDISVWARRTLSDGKVALYGRTYYSQATGKYEFKNAKELNL